MALYSTLASLSQTAASNVADGAVDAPSTIDQQTNLLASFIAQLRDGNGFATGLGNLGQCRLTKSGANLLLSPFQGNGLTINGVVCKIPSAGLTLAPTALTPGTTYYIYAVATGTNVSSIEASTTGHSTDTTTGVEIKTGDATRTLVGMARPITGPAWQDAADQRLVISWFNRKPLGIRGATGANAPTLSTSLGELSATFRNQFLSWAGDAASVNVSGSASNNSALNTCVTALYLDGSGLLTQQTSTSSVSNANVNIGSGVACLGLTEGYHYFTFFAAVSGGTGTWLADVVLSSVVQG